MHYVSSILPNKRTGLLCIESDRSIGEAAERMCHHSVGSLVVKESDNIVGLISEQEVIKMLAAHGNNADAIPVNIAMRKDLAWVYEDTELIICLHQMTHERRRYLLVHRDADCDLISIGDVVKAIIEDQRETIDHLGSWISGVPSQLEPEAEVHFLHPHDPE